MPARCKMRVEVRGVVYPDVHACAKALGVTPSTVYHALCKGKLDTLGMGRGKLKRPDAVGGKAMGVKIGPLHFRSMAQASVFLGFRRQYLWEALRGGNKAAKQNVMRVVMELASREENQAFKEMYGRRAA